MKKGITLPTVWWAPVKGYEGLYEVSIDGEVRSLERIDCRGQLRKERILKPRKKRGGYLRVNLCRDGKVKTHPIHRLVAEAWLKNPDNLPCINHKDENPSNNHVSNLEFCTYQYNNTFGTAIQRRTEKNTNGKKSIPVVALDKQGRIVHVFPSTREAGRNGFNQGAVSACCRKVKKTYKGLIWLYREDFLKKIS